MTEIDDYNGLIQFAAGNPAQADVFLGWQLGNDRLRLLHLPMTGDLASTVREGARDVSLSCLNRALIPHNVANDADANDLEYRALSDTPGAGELVDALNGVASPDTYSGGSDPLEQVAFTATVVRNRAEDRAILVRRVTTKRFLAREQSGLWVRMTQTSGAFEELDDDLLHLDNDYACVIFGETAFVLRSSPFERIFDFEHYQERFSEEALTEIVEHLPFDDPSTLISSLRGYKQLRRKLAAARDLRLFEVLSVEDLEEFASSRGLPVEFADDVDRGRVIVVDASAEARQALMNLLTDSILASGLTEQEYVVSGKRPLNP